MALPPHIDPDDDTMLLSYVTRLLLSELDHDVVAARAVENLADLAHSDTLGLFELDPKGENALCLGGFKDLAIIKPQLALPIVQGPAARVLEAKQPMLFGLDFKEGLPWPVEDGGLAGRWCCCAPLVAADNLVTGLVTFESRPGPDGDPDVDMPLLVCLTVAAMGLQTARLFQMAVIDGLTGLFVRRYFDFHLSEESARISRYGGQVSLLLLDVDHFKHINDTQGHQAGDALLKDLAREIKQQLRQKVDIPCRYGGDEMAVIMPNTGLEGALRLAERIRLACRRQVRNGDESAEVTVSLGLASNEGRDALSAEDLLNRADRALLTAKRKGRDRVETWREVSDEA